MVNVHSVGNRAGLRVQDSGLLYRVGYRAERIRRKVEVLGLLVLGLVVRKPSNKETTGILAAVSFKTPPHPRHTSPSPTQTPSPTP